MKRKIIITTFMLVLSLFGVFTISASAEEEVSKDGIKYELRDDGTAIVTGYNAVELADNIVIPETVEGHTVTEIGALAFCFCEKLKGINQNSITGIGVGAFACCTNLETVVMNSVTLIGDSAFSGCESLKSAKLSSAVTIGNQAFASCPLLDTVEIPSVVTIGECAFIYCYGLTSFSLPVSLKEVINDVFYDCTNLKTVYFQGDVPQGLRDITFNICTALEEIFVRPEYEDGYKAVFGSLQDKVKGTYNISGFTLSDGNIWIIIVGAVVILGGVAAIVIASKKKKTTI